MTRLRVKTRPTRRRQQQVHAAEGAELSAIVRGALYYLTPTLGAADFLMTALRAEAAACSAPQGLAALARAYLLVERLQLQAARFTAEELVVAAFLMGLLYLGLPDGDTEAAARRRVARSFGMPEARMTVVSYHLVNALG